MSPTCRDMSPTTHRVAPILARWVRVADTIFSDVVAVCVGSSRHLLDFSEFVCRNILWYWGTYAQILSTLISVMFSMPFCHVLQFVMFWRVTTHTHTTPTRTKTQSHTRLEMTMMASFRRLSPALHLTVMTLLSSSSSSASIVCCHRCHPPPSISCVHCLIVVSFLFHHHRCRRRRRRPLVIVVDVRRPSTLSSVILPLPRCTV